ncbi:Ig-like domain-containing protein [Mesorhizobium sp. M0138]|uniref:Ig-like domain-containing protein n=1 Tax=Mesorhizobium sp. M0138 TaxID=2956891 RepID=UPI003334E81B
MRRAAPVIAILLAVGCGGAYLALRNRLPEAARDTLETSESTRAAVAALANDADPDGDPIKVTAVGEPQHGTAEVGPDGSIVYTPAERFSGSDTFTYTVSDDRGGTATADVDVEVKFSPPTFHVRSQAASLQEMLAEPATSAYGSTINLFVYRDETGQARRLAIAGHADSITCSHTSAAFSKALLGGRFGRSGFLLAGAGQVSIPALGSTGDQADPDVEAYIREKQVFDFMTTLGQAGTEEGRAQKERLDALAEKDAVKAYLAERLQPDTADAFLREAREIADRSGLLRIHDGLPFSLVGAVEKRLHDAATKPGDGAIIRFDDLLPAETPDAVVYMRMLHLGSGEPVVLQVEGARFTTEAFRRAAAANRSALENAIVKSAQRRLEHATRLVDRIEGQARDCRSLPAEQRSELLSGTSEICDKDICRPATDETITRGTYCDENVPFLQQQYAGFKAEAEDVLAQMEAYRTAASKIEIDTLTHAALLDSMLRDWALPIPDAQEAFDLWRTEERPAAWQALTEAMAAQGNGRAALAGESVVFDASVENDVVTVRPVLAIDLRRTRLVIDPKIGVTAAITPWEMRKLRPSELAADDPAQTLATDPARFADAIAREPRRAASAFVDHQLGRLPARLTLFDTLRSQGLRTFGKEIEQQYAPGVDKALQAPPSTQTEAAAQLDELRDPLIAAADVPGISPRMRVATAYVLVRGIALLDGKNDAWRQMKGGLLDTDRDLARFLGRGYRETVEAILQRARDEDKGATDALLSESSPPRSAQDPDAGLPVVTSLGYFVLYADRARSVMLLRDAVDRAFLAYGPDGSVDRGMLLRALQRPDDIVTTYDFMTWQFLSDSFHAYMPEESVSPVDAQKFAAILAKLQDALAAQLKQFGGALSAVQLSQDQQVIVLRLLFDEGDYEAGLERLAGATMPVAALARDGSWSVLAPDLKGIPSKVVLASSGSDLVALATIGDRSTEVLKFGGLDPVLRDSLAGQVPAYPGGAWREETPLWEQIFLAEVAGPPDAGAVSAFIGDEARRTALLKAIVYTCAGPMQSVLTAGQRCGEIGDTQRLHDRARDIASVTITVPDDGAADAAARTALTAPLAWRRLDPTLSETLTTD